MSSTNVALLELIACNLLLVGMFVTILTTQKIKSHSKSIFLVLLGLCSLWTTPLVIKIIFQHSDLNLYTFEAISGVGNYLTPPFFLLLTYALSNVKYKFKPKYLLLFIIPIISCILLITNESHHLLFANFSTELSEIEYGPYYIIAVVYMYLLYAIGIVKLFRFTTANSGFFSRQFWMIIIGISVPLVVNILGTLRIISITTYTTPITFSITFVMFAFAIFKFNIFNTTPVALQSIVDRMSDGYVILNPDCAINDFNKMFHDTFNLGKTNIRGMQFERFIETRLEDSGRDFILEFHKRLNKISSIKNKDKTVDFEYYIPEAKQFFRFEVSNIYSGNLKVGILILMKDITQHKNDVKQIEDNQDRLIEKERLASLGQMIGGIAHNLKTPIFSISGGIEGLEDLVSEFDSSIDDPEVNSQDMHDIAQDMRDWLGKLKGYNEYMNDVITAVKGRAVALNESEDIADFSITELYKYIDILTKHEMSKNLVELEMINIVPDNYYINGSVNGLVQVVDNIIDNGVEAYLEMRRENKSNSGEKIILKSELYDRYIRISIQDFGPGLPQEVRNKLFKQMVTTKGKDGTGLGLFMSYSNIKAHFKGEMSFTSTPNKGTTFFIDIPYVRK